ncbi:zinc finger BED domain-containing protein 6-like [Mesoplodon densirostris]|uniref:zinc finger BED domain-containing protein 6-like n=1 Tax=Mesoplodon densirostris TaxID=48708 RepID=UPI0028DC446D|nr:zinc finger BED domain-containing protein 6-like [Mesoplodon densirostris]
MGGYTHAPCFAHCLDSLVGNFCVTIIVSRSCWARLGPSAATSKALRKPGGSSQLQRQCGLPAHQPFLGLSHPWVSAYPLLEWLETQQLGKAGAALSAVLRSLADSLVKLPQPFWTVVREVSSAQAALSLVLPQPRYLHVFPAQVRGRFEERSAGEMGVAVWLAEGLALQLSTDHQLPELFHHEQFVLATLLDPASRAG